MGMTQFYSAVCWNVDSIYQCKRNAMADMRGFFLAVFSKNNSIISVLIDLVVSFAILIYFSIDQFFFNSCIAENSPSTDWRFCWKMNLVSFIFSLSRHYFLYDLGYLFHFVLQANQKRAGRLHIKSGLQYHILLP